MKTFNVDNVYDVKELVRRGYQPIRAYINKYDSLRFVFEDTNDCFKVFKEVRQERLAKKEYKYMKK